MEIKTEVTATGSLRAGAEELFGTGEHADITLRFTDGTALLCHKAWLCAGSKFFKNAFKKGTFKESDDDVIELRYLDGDTLRRMVKHLYHSSLGNILQGCGNKLLTCLQLYEAARFYMIPSLTEITEREFMFKAKTGFNACDASVGPESLEAVDWYFGQPDNAASSSGILPDITKLLVSNLDVIYGDEGSKEKFFVMLKDYAALSADFAQVMVHAWSGYTKMSCSLCGYYSAMRKSPGERYVCVHCGRKSGLQHVDVDD